MTITFPDDLLERLDAYARRRGMTRSAALQALTEHELAAHEPVSDPAQQRAEIRELLAGARPHGGDSVRLIREQRNAR